MYLLLDMVDEIVGHGASSSALHVIDEAYYLARDLRAELEK